MCAYLMNKLPCKVRPYPETSVCHEQMQKISTYIYICYSIELVTTKYFQLVSLQISDFKKLLLYYNRVGVS